MKPVHWAWFLLGLFLLLVVVPRSTFAAPATLEDRLADFVRARATGTGISVDVPALPVSAAEREQLDASFSLHPRQAVVGRVPVRVSLLRGHESVRSLVVPVDVASSEAVLVLTRSVRAGQRIDSGDIELRAKDSRGLPRDALRDFGALRGLRARRTLPAGSVLRTSRLEEVTDVQRGQRVKLLLHKGGLKIEAAGRAREDGNVGDWIEAQHWTSRRTVMGRVGENGVLHVEP